MGYGTFKKKMKTCRNGNKFYRRFKFIIFGDSFTKLIFPENNKISCDECACCNFSQNGAKVKDIYNQIEYLKKVKKTKHKDSKVEKIIILVTTNHIQKEGPVNIPVQSASCYKKSKI